MVSSGRRCFWLRDNLGKFCAELCAGTSGRCPLLGFLWHSLGVPHTDLREYLSLTSPLPLADSWPWWKGVRKKSQWVLEKQWGGTSILGTWLSFMLLPWLVQSALKPELPRTGPLTREPLSLQRRNSGDLHEGREQMSISYCRSHGEATNGER